MLADPPPTARLGGVQGQFGVHEPKNGPWGAERMFAESVQGHHGASVVHLVGLIGHGVGEIQNFWC